MADADTERQAGRDEERERGECCGYGRDYFVLD